MEYYIIFLCIGYLSFTDGYVLLQMRKDANDSKMDAVIHKKLPGEQFDNLARRLSRKQLRMGGYSSESGDIVETPKHVEPLVFGVNTGAKVVGKSSEGVAELLQLLQNVVKDDSFVRSKKFEFNDSGSEGKKSSVGIELDTQTLIDSVKRFIASKKFKKTANEIARKAAIIYRAIRDDM